MAAKERARRELDELWIDVYLHLDKHAVKLPVYECI